MNKLANSSRAVCRLTKYIPALTMTPCMFYIFLFKKVLRNNGIIQPRIVTPPMVTLNIFRIGIDACQNLEIINGNAFFAVF